MACSDCNELPMPRGFACGDSQPAGLDGSGTPAGRSGLVPDSDLGLYDFPGHLWLKEG